MRILTDKKLSALAVTAVTAGLGLAALAPSEASASIYAGSRLIISGLTINVNASNTEDVSFGFKVDSSASLSGTGSDGTTELCGGAPGANNDCGTDPVLGGGALGSDAQTAFYFGDGTARGARDYVFDGPGSTEYGSSNSEISTASLVNLGVPTSTKSIAEAEIQPSGTGFEQAGANAGVFSDTSLTWTFTIPEIGDYLGEITISFLADLDVLSKIDYLEPPFVSGEQASAGVSTEVTLSKDGSTDKAVWNMNGILDADPCTITGAAFGCTNETDTNTLNEGYSVSSNGEEDSNGAFYNPTTLNDFTSFAITITGLTAGTYNIVLDADVDALVRATSVPEPNALALMGAGLMGVGMAGVLSRRRRRTDG